MVIIIENNNGGYKASFSVDKCGSCEGNGSTREEALKSLKDSIFDFRAALMCAEYELQEMK